MAEDNISKLIKWLSNSCQTASIPGVLRTHVYPNHFSGGERRLYMYTYHLGRNRDYHHHLTSY